MSGSTFIKLTTSQTKLLRDFGQVKAKLKRDHRHRDIGPARDDIFCKLSFNNELILSTCTETHVYFGTLLISIKKHSITLYLIVVV